MPNQTKSNQAVNQAVKQGPLPLFTLRTGVRAASDERQQCYMGYLSNGVVGADAQCGNNPGCWRGTVGHAIDNANAACLKR